MFHVVGDEKFDEFTKFPMRVHLYFRTRLFKCGNTDNSSFVVRVWPPAGESYNLNYTEFCENFPE